MKKVLSMLLVFLMLTLSSCDFFEKEVSEEDYTKNTAIITANLDSAYNLIAETKEYTDLLASVYLDNFYHPDFNYFYQHEDFESFDASYVKYSNSSTAFWNSGKQAFAYRKNIEKGLENSLSVLKKTPPNEDTQQYYDAVKELYLQVSAYYNFLKVPPTGLYETFSDSISEYKEDYAAQKSEVDFNR